MFVHTGCVRPSFDYSVKRFVKGKSRRVDISSVRAHKAYYNHLGAIDKNGRNNSEWTITMQTNRCYLRLFCRVLDRVVYTVFVIVIYLAGSDIG